MRQHKILTRTLLILSIINFALAAPAAVRGRPEVRLDVNVTRNVTAVSQKRQDTLDEGGSTNVPGLDHHDAPSPSPDLTDKLSQIATHTDSPSPPDSPWSLTGMDYVPPSPGSPTESRLPVGSTPVAGSLSPPSPPSPPPHTSQPGPSEDRFPSPSGFSVNPNKLSATGSTVNEQIPPQSPGVDPEMHSLLNAEPEPLPTEFWDDLLNDKIGLTVNQPTSPQSPEVDTEMHTLLNAEPWPLPTGFWDDLLNKIGLTVNQPTSPQSPEVDTEMHTLPNAEPEPLSAEFWDDLLKGKIKRRISGSDVVDLAQKDPRFSNFPRRRHDAAIPLHGPLGQLRNRRKSVSRGLT